MGFGGRLIGMDAAAQTGYIVLSGDFEVLEILGGHLGGKDCLRGRVGRGLVFSLLCSTPRG